MQEKWLNDSYVKFRRCYHDQLLVLNDKRQHALNIQVGMFLLASTTLKNRSFVNESRLG